MSVFIYILSVVFEVLISLPVLVFSYRYLSGLEFVPINYYLGFGLFIGMIAMRIWGSYYRFVQTRKMIDTTDDILKMFEEYKK